MLLRNYSNDSVRGGDGLKWWSKETEGAGSEDQVF
jgi:hypothetical protein